MAKPWMDFASLRARADFGAVLAHYRIAVPNRQDQVTVLCPFHDDRRPSMSVSLERNLFQCFACQAKGDVIDFVARIEDVPLPDAARLIADLCDMAPQTRRSELGTAASDRSEHEGLANTRPYSPGTLDPTHPYLTDRGLTPNVIEAFGLGYCRQGRLRGRICIPIHSPDGGRVVAFAGRWAGDRVPDGIPRYLMPRGFKKSAVLFNYHRALPAEHLVVVEGYWSVFRLHGLKIPAVALMGTSLSGVQTDLLYQSGARQLTLLLDGDEAGRNATATLLPRLASRFFVRAPTLPEGGSPDDVPEKDLLDAMHS